MRGYAVASVLLLAPACSRPTPDVAVATHEHAAPKPPTPDPQVLFRFTADLDGKGTELVSLEVDGVLRVGALARKVELARNEFFFAEQASLRVVDIDGAMRGLLFTEPTSEGEDPSNRYRLYLKTAAGLEVALDRVIGVYGVTPLTFSGKGDARFIEDAWTACEGAGPGKGAKIHEVTLRLDAALQLVETSRTAVGTVANCSELSG